MKIITVVLTLLVILLLAPQGWCQEAVLTPLEYVAYEGQPKLTFQCSVTGPGVPAFFVSVDGLQGSESLSQRGITTSEPMQLGNTTFYQQNITVSATQLNEDTTIECFGVVFSEVTNTAIATFKVQGLLDPPTITEPVEHGTAHQILTWTPPFTLDITDLDPDITYRVCNNDTNTCVNTTDTVYNFPTTCFPVEYSVSACNPVDCSDSATMLYPNKGLTVVNISVFLNPLRIVITLKADIPCIGTYFVNLIGSLGNGEMMRDDSLRPQVTDVTHEVTLMSNSTAVLKDNNRYDGTIGIDGVVQGTITFLTFDVQGINAEYNGRSLTVTCRFAPGSNALGCMVMIHDIMNISMPMEMNITRNSTSDTASGTINEVPPSTYQVLGFDIEFDGSVTTSECEPVKEVFTFNPPASSMKAVLLSATVTPTPVNGPTSPTEESGSDSSVDVIVGVIGVVVGVTTISIIVVVAFVMVLKMKHGKRPGAFGKSSEESTLVTTVHLSRIASDGESPVVNLSRIASDGGTPVPRPPPYQDMDVGLPPPIYTAQEQLVGPTYAELGPGVSRTSRGVVPSSNPPTFYSELQQRSLQADPNLRYAELGSRPTTIPQNAPIKEGETKYAEILPHARPTTQPATQTAPLTSATVADHEMNVENLTAILYECRPKWQVIGEVFGLTEDLLDEIFTNNDSTYDCLIQMVIWYLRRAETTPIWEDIARALETEAVGETRLADLIRERYGTGINLPGMVSSPSLEHGHFESPVQETKSAPGEAVYPSMPGEEPPPPPPPRIRAEEDAPPLPPRMEDAEDMFDTADFRDTLQPSQCTEEGGSLPSWKCFGMFLGISGPCYPLLRKPESDSEPNESFGDLSPPSQQSEDTALTLKGQTIFPKLKTQKSAFTAKRLSTVVYSVPSKPGNETSEEHPAEESTEVAGITEIGDGGRIRSSYLLLKAVETLQKAAYGVRNRMAMITECILHVSPKWKAISAEPYLAEGLPEAPNNRMVSLGWIKEESLMRSLLAHIPTATLDVTIQSGAWRWSIAIAMRDKAVIFSSTLLNFVHM